MQYLHHPEASKPTLELTGDMHRYIFKVRRHAVGENLYLRNLNDEYIYLYTIESMDKKEAILKLLEKKSISISAEKYLHIGWCIIDPKSIERILPTLNEVGVGKITFIYCNRSQKQFKPDIKRLEKITLNSSQQCGRSIPVLFDFVEDLATFIAQNPQSYLLNFSDRSLKRGDDIATIVVGCEGGLSSEEIELFAPDRVVGLSTPMILRSESAVASLASILLL